jgi:Phage tail lysozyme
VPQPVPQGRPQSGPQTAPYATAQRKPRLRARTAVPAAAIAATLAAGAAAYGFTSASAAPDPAKLTAALDAPAVVDAVTHGGGRADAAAAASILLRPHHAAATGAASAHASAPVGKPARSQASRQAAATHPAAQPSQAAPAATATVPSPSPSATQSAQPATTVSCSDSSYLLPANVTAIVSFLLANGYSDNAAAGIAGNIYQESKGDPESIGTGGGGLIGWTPLPSGFVTGNTSADLQTQLSAILTYDNGWSGYLPELNSAATPADAAYIYVTDFERAGIPAAGTREAAAEAVASACGI